MHLCDSLPDICFLTLQVNYMYALHSEKLVDPKVIAYLLGPFPPALGALAQIAEANADADSPGLMPYLQRSVFTSLALDRERRL